MVGYDDALLAFSINSFATANGRPRRAARVPHVAISRCIHSGRDGTKDDNTGGSAMMRQVIALSLFRPHMRTVATTKLITMRSDKQKLIAVGREASNDFI